MSKRVVIEWICDQCARIVTYEHVSLSFAGNVAKVDPYPKDWKTYSQHGKTIDVCPDCPIPVIEIHTSK